MKYLVLFQCFTRNIDMCQWHPTEKKAYEFGAFVQEKMGANWVLILYMDDRSHEGIKIIEEFGNRMTIVEGYNG